MQSEQITGALDKETNMATANNTGTATSALAQEGSFDSIEVIQPPVPSLRIKLSDPAASTVLTEGMPGVTAVERPA